MASVSRILRNLSVGLALVLALPGGAQAQKTLMWLVDWYQMGNVDTITKVNSVVIPHYDGTAGYFFSTADQALALTKAYAAPIPVNTGYRNDTLPDSLKIPLEMPRSWYAISNFNTGNYQSNRIRIYLSYAGQKHMPMLNRPDPKVQVDVYPTGAGQTDQLEGKFVNGCIDSTFGDTVWFWTGALTAAGISSNASSSSIKCLDHNPFFEKIGTVHVLNPWPGKTVYAQLGDKWYPLYQEAGRPGWVTTTLWADPRTPQSFKIRLANADPTVATTVQYWDAGGIGPNATGAFLDYSVAPGKGKEVWILPPFGGATKPAVTKAPPVALTLYVKRPSWSASAVRVVQQGLDARFIASSTKYCDWFEINFYQGAVPANIVLTNPVGDTIYGNKGKARAPTLYSAFTDWIDLTKATGAVVSLNTDANTPLFLPGLPSTGGLCDTKVLAFSAYDFKGANGTIPATDPLFYEPFSQSGPDNNCPTSGNTATKGLVLASLNATTGMPTMNSSHKPACGINTAVATNSPGLWFDTLWRSSTGVISGTNSTGATALNKFHCVRVPLRLDAAGLYYSYANSKFWPLDSAMSIPDPYRNATGSDFKFAMHAKAAFEYVPGLKFEFNGDDDVWIFINKKLALDVGGQHGPNGGTINVDNLGLVEGKSYQFDMFYTERQGDGSSISIKTTMNLVPVIEVSFDTTLSSGKTTVIDSRITETTADASKCVEEGSASTVSTRAGNPVYTLIFPDGTELQIDSTYLANAMPGASISQNGSRLTVDTSAVQKSGRLTMSGLYQIRVDLGSDSRLVTWSNVSKAVEVVGDLFDANGDGRPDSVVLHVVGSAPAFMKPINAVLRWADRAGKLDSTSVTALVRQPGDSVLVGTFLLPDRTQCPPTGCKTNMGNVYTQLFQDTVRNPIVELADRIAPVADTAWLIYDTTGAVGAKDTMFVRVSEPLLQFSGALPVGDSAWVLTGRTAIKRPIAGQAVLADGGLLLKLAIDPKSNPVQPGDSVRLGGFSGDALGNAPWELSKWVFLKADPVATSWMLDRSGDGAPDQIRFDSRGDLSKATNLVVHWKTTAGADTALNLATPTGVTALVDLPANLWKNSTSCAGCYVEVVIGTQVSRFRLLDSVPAVALKADFRFGQTKDTLIVLASEPVVEGNLPNEGWFGLKNAGDAGALGTRVSVTGAGPGTLLTLVLDIGAISGDSLRLRGWAVDANNVVPGAVSPFVPVAYGPQPIRVVLRDLDGDGRADDIEYRLTRSVTGAPVPTAFGATWNGLPGSAASLVRSTDQFSWRGPIGPFGLATSGQAGDKGWISVGADVSSFAAAVEDSIAPVATAAKLIFGFDPGSADTVEISGSETMSFAGLDLAWLGADSGTATPTIVPVATTPAGRSNVLKIAVPAGSIASNMAWARFGTGVSDGSTSVKASSRWVPLKVTPSGRAALYDNDGDGKANFVSVRMRGVMTATHAFVKWAGVEQQWQIGGSRTGNFTLDPSDSGLWFAKGATACGDAPCTIRFMDGLTEVATWNLIDSVAPMVIAARYTYGDAGADTLRVKFSEPMQVVSTLPSWVEWGSASGVGAVIHDASVANLATGGADAILVLSGSNIAATDWDKIRIATGALAGKIQDMVGVGAGSASPFAPLTFGLPPMTSAVFDPTGAGRATHVSISTLRDVSPLSLASVKSWTLLWSGDSLVVDASALQQSSQGHWSGVLPSAFRLGVTSCESPCKTTASGGTERRSIALVDSVPPSLVSAKFRYSRPEVERDTLILELSEPWPAQQPGDLSTPLVMVGRLSDTARDITPMKDWRQTGPRSFMIVVDTSWQRIIRRGDSARLSHNGGLSKVLDVPGNRVGVLSRWVPVEFGERPLELIIRQEHAVLVNGRGDIPAWTEPAADVPGLEMLVRDDLTGNYVQVDGTISVGPDGTVTGTTPGKNNPARTMDVYIKLNRPLDGAIFVYDNMGVGVHRLDLSELKKLWPEGSEDVQREVKIQWNGTDRNNKFVSGGVYLLRAVVKYRNKDGRQDFKNLLWKYGWVREIGAK
ncbi:MAG: fibro-slime domain-containing protein [Fibrobacteres bacterium]|nr:fibro-slime domain-containing protein [Fibrobacterota bacterium]